MPIRWQAVLVALFSLSLGVPFLIQTETQQEGQLPPQQPFSVPLASNLPVTTTQSNTPKMKKEKQGDWQDETCQFVRPGTNGYVVVEAMSAVYDIKYESGGGYVIPVVVFFGSNPGSSWVGPRQDLYVETATGIVGMKIQVAGMLFWTDSLSKNATRTFESTTRLEDLAESVEDVLPVDLVNAHRSRDWDDTMNRGTDMSRMVKSSWFFDIGPGAQGGIAKILGAETDGSQLKLSMENQTHPLRADVWIDMETKAAIKGVMTHDPYDGKWPIPE